MSPASGYQPSRSTHTAPTRPALRPALSSPSALCAFNQVLAFTHPIHVLRCAWLSRHSSTHNGSTHNAPPLKRSPRAHTPARPPRMLPNPAKITHTTTDIPRPQSVSVFTRIPRDPTLRPPSARPSRASPASRLPHPARVYPVRGLSPVVLVLRARYATSAAAHHALPHHVVAVRLHAPRTRCATSAILRSRPLPTPAPPSALPITRTTGLRISRPHPSYTCPACRS